MFYFLISQWISELRRPIASKLCTVINICANFLMQVQKFGGPPLKIFTSAKFWVDFRQLPTFIANISGTSQDIEIRKDMWSRAIPTAWRWTLVHYPQSSTCEFGPTKVDFFSTDYISTLRGVGRWPLKFLHALDTGQSLLAHTANRVGVPPQKKNF